MLKKTGLIALGTISSIFAVSCSNNGVGQNTDNDNKVSGDNSSSAPVITREYCADFFAPVQTMDINVLRDTKKTLCDITKTKLNEEGYKPVNAFSSMQNINIQFHKSQGSFSIFQNDGLLSTSMGVGIGLQTRVTLKLILNLMLIRKFSHLVKHQQALFQGHLVGVFGIYVLSMRKVKFLLLRLHIQMGSLKIRQNIILKQI